MKRLISILAIATFCLFFNNPLNAQNDDQALVVVEYMKVKPGMWDKYIECEQAWKIIHQERVKAGYITNWELERVVFPSGTMAEYDFVVITHFKNWDAIDAEDGSTFATIMKAMPADKSEIANNAEDYRDLIKREIWRAADMVFSPDAKNPKYRVENFMSIPTDGWGQWVEMETKFAKPFIEKSIEMGNRAGWLIGSMVLPRGDEFPYQVSSIDFYNSWEDMNKSDRKAWEAVYGDMEDEEIGERINSSRRIVRSEVRVLVDSVK